MIIDKTSDVESGDTTLDVIFAYFNIYTFHTERSINSIIILFPIVGFILTRETLHFKRCKVQVVFKVTVPDTYRHEGGV